MSEFLRGLLDQWERIRTGSVPLPSVAMIPPDRCSPTGSAGYRIQPDKMYFTVQVNEMHLAANRQWWAKFDPLVVIVTEFNYGTKRIAIPKIVGPELIPDPTNGGKPMHGIVLEDTLVAGPHPYRGGDVVISVQFYQVVRDDFVRSLLRTVSSISKLAANLHDLDAMVAIGGAILTGVEGLLGLATTTCLAAYRGSLAPSLIRPFSAQFSALLTPPVLPDLAVLSVCDGRLVADADVAPVPYRGSDFVLISVEGMKDRDDLNQLPFNARRLAALKALREGRDGITRAKGILTTGYGEMLESPDMTSGQADRVFEVWRQELSARKSELEKMRALSQAEHEPALDPNTTRLNEAVHLLDDW